MPTYEYQCKCCCKTHEVEQSIKDEPLETCPVCKVYGGLTRLISGGTSFTLKGDGWADQGYASSKKP